MVDQECLKGKEFDLLSSSNEAVTDSEVLDACILFSMKCFHHVDFII